MTELVRPSHYQAHHAIVDVAARARPGRIVDVVGPVCETGDFLALDRLLPDVDPGEYLAVLCAGAYGSVMSSTYNSRPRAPEVLIDGGRFALLGATMTRGFDYADYEAGRREPLVQQFSQWSELIRRLTPDG